MRHQGSCHCKAVLIEVEAPEEIEAYECNCTMCARTGYLHLIVQASAFKLVRGEDALSLYTFNTGMARHYFCRHCGCRPFYVPRSNPDGFSVNVRCLDPATIKSLTVIPFDGQNWEANADHLAHLSKEPRSIMPRSNEAPLKEQSAIVGNKSINGEGDGQV